MFTLDRDRMFLLGHGRMDQGQNVYNRKRRMFRPDQGHNVILDEGQDVYAG
jgi:hypothetical protein